MSTTATLNPAHEAAAAPAASGKATIVSVFVGDLDPTVGEDQLLDTFRNAGPIISVRVCRDIITRKSLGYGYVNFQQHNEAEQAIRALNYSTIGSRPVRLMWQQRDPALRISGQGNLFVRNLDNTTDHKRLVDLFSAFGPILSAKVITDSDGKSRGYGFVHFKDETAAGQAIQAMNGKQPEGWNNPLYVANFIRRNARIAMLVQNFTNVYIKHLLPTATSAEIESFFSKFGGISSAVAKQDSKGRTFAFCNFKQHEDAVKAIESMNEKDVSGLTPAGESLFVARAQHRAERLIELRQKYLQRQSRGNNLYVRNFDPTFTDENLRELFKNFGDIKSCRVMADEKGNPRGFGFVSFSAAEEANHALREMNGRMLNGKPLVVNVAQRRDHRLSMLQVQFHQRLQNMVQPLAPMFYAAHKGFLSGPPQAGSMASQLVSSPPQMMMQQQSSSAAAAAAQRTMMMMMLGGVPPQQAHQQQHHHQGKSNQAAGATAGAANAASSGKRRGGARGHQNQNQQQQPQQQQQQQQHNSRGQQNVSHSHDDSSSTRIPTLDELVRMAPDDRKRALGERLFPAVLAADVPEELTPKITGMLLELEPADGLSLLTDAKKLKEKIDEALCVLKSNSLS